MQLAAEARARGYRLECFDTLASTNDEAMRRAREGDPGQLWIAAQSQTSGRGRLGRTWISPAGNLHASLLLIDPAPLAHLPELGFVCGVALAEALAQIVGPRVRLKWPNDALLGGAKLSGILLESAQLHHVPVCVAGIGVNCVAHPDDLPYPATNLRSAGFEVTAAQMLEKLSARLTHWLDRWDRGNGFGAVRQAWLTHAAGLGEEISVSTPQGMRTGRFLTLDARGRLELDMIDGRIALEAGDVLLARTTAPMGAQGRD